MQLFVCFLVGTAAVHAQAVKRARRDRTSHNLVLDVRNVTSWKAGHVACAHHMSLDAMASWWPQNGYTDTDLMEETSATYPPAIKQKLERLVRWSEIPQISNLTSPAVISNTSTAGKVALLFPADWTETNPSTLSNKWLPRLTILLQKGCGFKLIDVYSYRHGSGEALDIQNQLCGIHAGRKYAKTEDLGIPHSGQESIDDVPAQHVPATGTGTPAYENDVEQESIPTPTTSTVHVQTTPAPTTSAVDALTCTGRSEVECVNAHLLTNYRLGCMWGGEAELSPDDYYCKALPCSSGRRDVTTCSQVPTYSMNGHTYICSWYPSLAAKGELGCRAFDVMSDPAKYLPTATPDYENGAGQEPTPVPTTSDVDAPTCTSRSKVECLSAHLLTHYRLLCMWGGEAELSSDDYYCKAMPCSSGRDATTCAQVPTYSMNGHTYTCAWYPSVVAEGELGCRAIDVDVLSHNVPTTATGTPAYENWWYNAVHDYVRHTFMNAGANMAAFFTPFMPALCRDFPVVVDMRSDVERDVAPPWNVGGLVCSGIQNVYNHPVPSTESQRTDIGFPAYMAQVFYSLQHAVYPVSDDPLVIFVYSDDVRIALGHPSNECGQVHTALLAADFSNTVFMTGSELAFFCASGQSCNEPPTTPSGSSTEGSQPSTPTPSATTRPAFQPPDKARLLLSTTATSRPTTAQLLVHTKGSTHTTARDDTDATTASITGRVRTESPSEATAAATTSKPVGLDQVREGAVSTQTVVLVVSCIVGVLFSLGIGQIGRRRRRRHNPQANAWLPVCCVALCGDGDGDGARGGRGRGWVQFARLPHAGDTYEIDDIALGAADPATRAPPAATTATATAATFDETDDSLAVVENGIVAAGAADLTEGGVGPESPEIESTEMSLSENAF